MHLGARRPHAPRRRTRLVAGLLLCAALVPTVATADEPRPTLGVLGLSAWTEHERLSSDPRIRASVAYRIGRYAPRPGDGITRDRPRVNYDAMLAEMVVSSPELVVRLAVVSALAERGTPDARTTLLLLAGAGESVGGVARLQPEVQTSALRALRSYRLEPRDWQPILAGAVGQLVVHAEMVEAAAALLAAQPDDVFYAVLGATMTQPGRQRVLLRAIGLRGDPRLYARFLHNPLNSPSPSVAQEAAMAAVRLHSTEAVSDLSAIFRQGNTRDLETRRTMLRALGSLGGPFDPSLVRTALADPTMRAAALDACSRLGDTRYIPELARILAAPWVADRRDAAETLGALGGDAAASVLTARLGNESDASVRAALWHALARSGTDAADDAIARAAGSETTARWALVERALHGGASGRVPAGLQALAARGDESALALAGALGVFEPEILRALQAPDAGTRTAAALGLWFGGHGGDAIERALETMLLREDDEGARVAAVEALARSGGGIARETLVAMTVREAEGPTLAGMAAAAAAADLGLPVAASLRQMLGDPSPLVRAIAARSLGRLGAPDAAPSLEFLIRFDPSARVRSAAALALGEVGGAEARATLETLEHSAWESGLSRDALAALAVARGESPTQRFAGSAVGRVSGAPQRSVWGVWQPDGTLRFAVASGDGELLVPGIAAGDGSTGGRPSEGAPMFRLDAE